MKSHFDAEFFAGNRRRLRELFTGTAPIILTANGLLQRNNDSAYPFRQDSNFWYLTGLNQPDLVLVIDKDKEYLILPERSQTQDIFDGAVDGNDLVARSGIADALDSKSGWKRLGARLKKVKHVATIAPPPAFIKQHGMYTNPSRRRLVTDIRKYDAEIKLLDLRQHLSHMRMIKQPEELAAIKEAIAITGRGFDRALRKVSSAGYEYEVEAVITESYRAHGAGHAYQPIVAAGANACVLHYVDNDSGIDKGALLLIDSGAEAENYAADITRTFPVGEVSKRQNKVMKSVREVQEFAYSQLRPGATIKAYEKAVEQFMGEKLRELGLIKTISQENVRTYYPHATSHFLGLDVHDAADYEKPLEAGMVLTVEPGIYIPDETIGVRIEDNVLITKKGVKILSAEVTH